jgi:superfamily II DNA helicase RecQ
MNERNFDKMIVELCRAEMETRKQLIECLREVNRQKLWKSHGRKSFLEYCKLDLGYDAKSIRDMMIQMGLIFPSEKLVSTHTETQKRIDQLRHWRREKSKLLGLPAYRFITNQTLMQLAETNPQKMSQLESVHGMGSKKIKDFGEEILSILKTSQSLIEVSAETLAEVPRLSDLGANRVDSFDQSGAMNRFC